MPEQTWYWWNTAQQRIEIATLPAVDIDAGPVGAAPDTAPSLPVKVALQAGALILSILLVVVLARTIRARSPSRQKRLLRRAAQALHRGDQRRAASLLYAWLNTRPEGADWLSLRNTAAIQGDGRLPRTVEALLRAAYSRELPAEIAGDGASALRLLRRSRPGTRHAHRDAGLRLNPVQPRK